MTFIYLHAPASSDSGADMVGLYEADGAGVYSGKVMSMEFTMFAGLEDGQPTSWVEGKGTIR